MIADFKNYGGKPDATAAALLLSKFAGDTPWVHLDIAGTAWYDDPTPYAPKGASGAGVRTLNVELYKDTAAFSPETSEKPRGLYEEEYSFVFDDFNFDGREDLAVCNGRDSGYGGPSYTVFLFDARAGRFNESRALSRLAEGEYLGLFFTDAKRRTLTAYSKGGCCYHETKVFRVVGDRPVLVEQVIEDATSWGGAPEGYVLITTKKKVRG